ncbi:phosphopantetheine-binding protein, partial [Escherichia coli]
MLFSSRKDASARKTTTKHEIALDGVHERVKAVFDNLLERQDYDLDTGFLELGGDSLKLVECACQLEEVFHIKLDVTQVGLNASVNGIAELIQHNLLEGNGKAIKINLQDECTLDPSIA